MNGMDFLDAYQSYLFSCVKKVLIWGVLQLGLGHFNAVNCRTKLSYFEFHIMSLLSCYDTISTMHRIFYFKSKTRDFEYASTYFAKSLLIEIMMQPIVFFHVFV